MKQEIDSNLGLTGNDGSQFFKSSTNMDFSQLESMSVQEWQYKNVHDSSDWNNQGFHMTERLW